MGLKSPSQYSLGRHPFAAAMPHLKILQIDAGLRDYGDSALNASGCFLQICAQWG